MFIIGVISSGNHNDSISKTIFWLVSELQTRVFTGKHIYHTNIQKMKLTNALRSFTLRWVRHDNAQINKYLLIWAATNTRTHLYTFCR